MCRQKLDFSYAIFIEKIYAFCKKICYIGGGAGTAPAGGFTGQRGGGRGGGGQPSLPSTGGPTTHHTLVLPGTGYPTSYNTLVLPGTGYPTILLYYQVQGIPPP